jgi:hypothetical protein
MMRTVWLATTCLAVLSALAVAKALTTPVVPIVERQVDETTVSTGLAQDRLTKADRLEVTYVRQETAAEPALPPTEPFIPPVPTIVPPVETKIISRHWHDRNATTSSAVKSKQPKKTVAAKKANRAADRSKLVEPVKPCDRMGAFGDLLRSLNLSPACDS